MPRYLALEWDAAELRGIAARKQGTEIVVERTWAIELAGADAVTGAVAKIVQDLGTNRIETLIAVGRASIELRVLQAPSVPPPELPDLVRFQALRQFSTLGEDWPLDFVQQADRGEEGLTVLAAALPPDALAQLKAPCEKAGLTITRIALRPFAAAATVREDSSGGRLLVDQLGDEADLTVISGGQVLLPRTVRLRSDEVDTKVAPLAMEIRRTMLAASNQLGGKLVEEILLFGDPHALAASAAKLAEELKLRVNVCDPFTTVTSEVSKPARPGRFAPLLGLLKDEARERRPEIDFLNPRRRPVPPDLRRLYALIGTVAAAVVLLPLVLMYLSLSTIAGEIDTLKGDLTRLTKDVKGLSDERQATADLDAFEKANIAWLDELKWLSEKFPAAEKVTADDITATALQSGGGRITIQATADASTTVAEMEPALRDPRHEVAGSGARFDDRLPRLKWRFSKTVTVTPTGEEQPAPEAGAKK